MINLSFLVPVISSLLIIKCASTLLLHSDLEGIWGIWSLGNDKIVPTSWRIYLFIQHPGEFTFLDRGKLSSRRLNRIQCLIITYKQDQETWLVRHARQIQALGGRGIWKDGLTTDRQTDWPTTTLLGPTLARVAIIVALLRIYHFMKNILSSAAASDNLFDPPGSLDMSRCHIFGCPTSVCASPTSAAQLCLTSWPLYIHQHLNIPSIFKHNKLLEVGYSSIFLNIPQYSSIFLNIP